MNRLKVNTPAGPRVIHIFQNPGQGHRVLALHGRWLRSPAESKEYALRQGWTLAGKRQS